MPLQIAGNQGQTGKQTGQGQILGLGEYTEALVTELQPAYYENAYRGNIFFAAHQAATTFSANGLTSASAVGFCLYNPANSGKNIIPIQCEAVMTNYITTSTNVQLVQVVSAFSGTTPTTATALTTYKAQGAMTPSGSIATACVSLTFAANPVIWKQLYASFVTTTIAAAIPTMSDMPQFEFKGSLIIPPGTGTAIVSNNASTGLVSMTWLELPT